MNHSSSVVGMASELQPGLAPIHVRGDMLCHTGYFAAMIVTAKPRPDFNVGLVVRHVSGPVFILIHIDPVYLAKWQFVMLSDEVHRLSGRVLSYEDMRKHFGRPFGIAESLCVWGQRVGRDNLFEEGWIPWHRCNPFLPTMYKIGTNLTMSSETVTKTNWPAYVARAGITDRNTIPQVFGAAHLPASGYVESIVSTRTLYKLDEFRAKRYQQEEEKKVAEAKTREVLDEMIASQKDQPDPNGAVGVKEVALMEPRHVTVTSATRRQELRRIAADRKAKKLLGVDWLWDNGCTMVAMREFLYMVAFAFVSFHDEKMPKLVDILNIATLGQSQYALNAAFEYRGERKTCWVSYNKLISMPSFFFQAYRDRVESMEEEALPEWYRNVIAYREKAQATMSPPQKGEMP